jgi:hypothetical protein
VAVPLLPLAIAFMPILVMHAALERDNAKYYQGAPAPRPTVTLYSPPLLSPASRVKARPFWPKLHIRSLRLALVRGYRRRSLARSASQQRRCSAQLSQVVVSR